MPNTEGPRPPTPEELPSLIKFLDSNLRSSVKWSIADEYPTTYITENLENLRIIKQGSDVLSHAAIKSIVVKTQFGVFKVAAIGGVVTSKDHRAQGYSRQIMEDCLTLSQNQAHDFAILWTNLYDHYRKLGFELAGTEVALIFDKAYMPVETKSLRFLKGPQVSAESIDRVYSQHTVISLRKINEIAKFLRIPNSNIYTAWSTATGHLVAYAIEGKGADLNGYIHEWGGGVNELSSLFNYILSEQKRSMTVICPAHSENLIRQLRPHVNQVNIGYLGMIKLLNRANVVAKIQRFSTQPLTDALMRIDEKELTQLIFGPHEISTFKNIPTNLHEPIKEILPMPFWIWGWDSV